MCVCDYLLGSYFEIRCQLQREKYVGSLVFISGFQGCECVRFSGRKCEDYKVSWLGFNNGVSNLYFNLRFQSQKLFSDSCKIKSLVERMFCFFFVVFQGFVWSYSCVYRGKQYEFLVWSQVLRGYCRWRYEVGFVVEVLQRSCVGLVFFIGFYCICERGCRWVQGEKVIWSYFILGVEGELRQNRRKLFNLVFFVFR